MRKNGIIAVLAAVMLLGSTVVYGAEQAPQATDNKAVFSQALDMTEAVGASVPGVTFNYTIAAGAAVAESSANAEVKAGVVVTDAQGNVTAPTIQGEAFSSADTVSSSKVVKNITVDFAGVTFTQPGIYRYVVNASPSGNADITNDAEPNRYLDAYVTRNADGSLSVTSYVVKKEIVNPAQTVNHGEIGYTYGEVAKSEGYTSTYKTYSLSLEKKVEGSMADLSRKFDFTLAFTGPAGTSFTCVIRNGGTDTAEAPVVLDENGTASVTGIQLNNSTGTYVITGVPSTVSYKITENIDDGEGYTTTHQINKGAATGTITTGTSTSADSTKELMGKNENRVIFTNTKNAVSPTGIVRNVLPYVLMVGIAILSIFAVHVGKKKEKPEK
nr:hypothetical protein [uncultured Blautia sp.]